METTIDRRRGCLIGLAVGDALGAAVEFEPRGSFPPVTDYRGGGPHGLGPGEWTDDTSMALALADSIATVGWDLDDQARRYLAWYREGQYSVTGRCFDIGITTSGSLSRFAQGGDARQSGDPSPRASGNGSIMRLAPVPIRYADLVESAPAELTRLASESSLPTHASPECLAACQYFALVLAGLIHGIGRDTVLSREWGPVAAFLGENDVPPAVAGLAEGAYRSKAEAEIVGSGYVIRSLEAALWAFHDAPDFETAVLRAVNLGDDADTTGAVCGQLAGSYWGESGIPARWRSGLAKLTMLEQALAGILAS